MTALFFVAGFKLVEYRFKRSILSGAPSEEDETPVAGPADQAARRRRIDQLLARAELPRLAEVEPLFPDQ